MTTPTPTPTPANLRCIHTDCQLMVRFIAHFVYEDPPAMMAEDHNITQLQPALAPHRYETITVITVAASAPPTRDLMLCGEHLNDLLTQAYDAIG